MSTATPQQRLAAARQGFSDVLAALPLQGFHRVALEAAAGSLAKAQADAAVAEHLQHRAGPTVGLGPN